jgi:hypothetical protein
LLVFFCVAELNHRGHRGHRENKKMEAKNVITGEVIAAAAINRMIL